MKNTDMFCFFFAEGFFWFRFFGYGIRIKDTRKHRLYFSDRVLKRGIRFGHWHLKFLNRDGYPFV